MSDLVRKLRKIPCGRVLGHGEFGYCSIGYLCSGCELREQAANEIERLRNQVSDMGWMLNPDRMGK